MTKPIIDLLGRSILSEELNAFMIEYHIPTDPIIRVDTEDRPYYTNADNDADGIYCSFHGYQRYKKDYGEPQARYSEDEEELFLREITIDTEFVETKKQSIVPLPFNLVLGDDKETVLKKIGKKPEKKHSIVDGDGLYILFDDYKIVTEIDEGCGLNVVRFIKRTVEEKQKATLQKTLKEQKKNNKNIKPENANQVLAFLDKLPTKEWRADEGEDQFLADNVIDVIENVLKDYVHTLAELTKEKNATKVYNSVKKIVYSLNKVNKKYDFCIETMEMEDICDFINNIVRAAGLEIDPAIDLTEEWREW